MNNISYIERQIPHKKQKLGCESTIMRLQNVTHVRPKSDRRTIQSQTQMTEIHLLQQILGKLIHGVILNSIISEIYNVTNINEWITQSIHAPRRQIMITQKII